MITDMYPEPNNPIRRINLSKSTFPYYLGVGDICLGQAFYGLSMVAYGRLLENGKYRRWRTRIAYTTSSIYEAMSVARLNILTLVLLFLFYTVHFLLSLTHAALRLRKGKKGNFTGEDYTCVP